MGASQSTRKVIVEGTDSIRVHKVLSLILVVPVDNKTTGFFFSWVGGVRFVSSHDKRGFQCNVSDHISTKVSKANRNLGIIFCTLT